LKRFIVNNFAAQGEKYMHVSVDQHECLGCGICINLCPEVFALDDEKAVASTEPVPVGVQKPCREASDRCPVNAIKIKE
jgi:ferredoxin